MAIGPGTSDNLYTLNADYTVSEYPAGLASPSATQSGFNDPQAIAVSPGGDVYVANAGNGTVSVLAPGSLVPIATLTGTTQYPLDSPSALAFDAEGDLYVANSGTTTVSVFSAVALASGASTIASTSTLGGLDAPDDLAVDANGNLYVLNDGNVVEFAAGSGPANPPLTGLSNPSALAVDASGDLYVLNRGDAFGATPGEQVRPWRRACRRHLRGWRSMGAGAAGSRRQRQRLR